MRRAAIAAGAFLAVLGAVAAAQAAKPPKSKRKSKPATAAAPAPPAPPELSPGERADAALRKERALRAAGDLGGASAALGEALSAVPDHPAALEDLILVQREQGRNEDALKTIEKLAAVREKAPAAQRADLLRQKALVQRLLKDESGASASLQAAVALQPEDVAALQALADVELTRGEAKDALATADKLDAAETAASRRAADAARADVDVLKARAQRQLKDLRGARKNLERALKLAPGRPIALRELVQVELEAGDLRRAREAGDRLVGAAEGRDLVAALIDQARLERAAKDDAAALASAERAAQLSPRSEPVLDELARLHEAQGRPREAAAVLDQLVTAPDATPAQRADAYRRLAQLRSDLKEPASARESLEKALALDPGDLTTLRQLVEADRSEPKDALALVESHRPSDESRQAAWLALRGLARAYGWDDAAREDFAAAVKRDARGVCFGDLFQRRDKLEPAYFDACLAAFPNDLSLYVDRGVAFFMAGRKDEAVADFRRALAVQPASTEASLSLASALAGLGRTTEALEAAEKAVGLAKDRKSPAFAQLVNLRDALKAKAQEPAKPEKS